MQHDDGATTFYAADVQALAAQFDMQPDFAGVEARTFAASFAGDPRYFWTAPPGLYRAPGDIGSTLSEIYARGIWGGGSGAGSNIENTLLYAAYVQHLIKHGVRSIVDLGCGDWRFSQYLDLAGRDYLGVDVVPSVVEANTKAYAREGVRFICADVTTFDIPACDLLLCKDVLQHLSNANVSAILARAAVAETALITNDFHPVNQDCNNGDTQPLNLAAAPFLWHGTPRLAFRGKIAFLAKR